MFLAFCWNLVEVSRLELVVGLNFQCSAQCMRPTRGWRVLRKSVGIDPCVPGTGQGRAGPGPEGSWEPRMVVEQRRAQLGLHWVGGGTLWAQRSRRLNGSRGVSPFQPGSNPGSATLMGRGGGSVRQSPTSRALSPALTSPDKPPRMPTLISPSRQLFWALSSCQGRDTALEP